MGGEGGIPSLHGDLVNWWGCLLGGWLDGLCGGGVGDRLIAQKIRPSFVFIFRFQSFWCTVRVYHTICK